MVKMAQIKHGASLTYLIGERYLDPDDWLNGVECANDQGWDEGYDYDTDRWTGSNCAVIAATNPMRHARGGRRRHEFRYVRIPTASAWLCATVPSTR